MTGEYSVLQPDGCVRRVRYTAGPKGFFPEVTYEGPCDPKNYLAPVSDLIMPEARSQELRNAADDEETIGQRDAATAFYPRKNSQYYAATVAQASPVAPIIASDTLPMASSSYGRR